MPGAKRRAARLGSGAIAVVPAIVLPVAAIGVWGRLLAPRAPNRLDNPMRTAIKLLLFVAASVLLAASGVVVVAVVVGAVCIAIVLAAELAPAPVMG